MRRRAAFLLVLTGLATGIIECGALALSSPAQAAVEFVFHVNGGELKKGESKEVKKSFDGATYKFQRSGGSPSVSYECKGMELTEKTSIVGGKPGTLALKMKWTTCTGSVGGKTCTGINIETPSRLHGEIIEYTGIKLGTVGMLFKPETGEEVVHFSATCGGVKDERAAEGSLVAEPLVKCSKEEENEFIFPGFFAAVNTTGGKVNSETTMEGSIFSISGSTFLFAPNMVKWGIC